MRFVTRRFLRSWLGGSFVFRGIPCCDSSASMPKKARSGDMNQAKTGTPPKMPAFPSVTAIPGFMAKPYRCRPPNSSSSRAVDWALDVGEGIVCRSNITPKGKFNILLSLLRALGAMRGEQQSAVDDPQTLALADPAEYRSRLESYWLLASDGAFDARDAFARAERGELPTAEDLENPAVLSAWASARAAVLQELQRQHEQRLRYWRVAIGLLAVGIARGQAL